MTFINLPTIIRCWDWKRRDEKRKGDVSNDATQSVNRHTVKFKGRSRMKQYVQNKLIKWGFKILVSLCYSNKISLPI